MYVAKKTLLVPNKVFSLIWIGKLSRNIANIYYGTFIAKSLEEEYGQDFYYDHTNNEVVRVESLTFQGYTLPPFHVSSFFSFIEEKENW